MKNKTTFTASETGVDIQIWLSEDQYITSFIKWEEWNKACKWVEDTNLNPHYLPEEKKPESENETDCLRRIDTQANTLCEHGQKFDNQNIRIEVLERGHRLLMERDNIKAQRLDRIENRLIKLKSI